jgi:hypothetical protein
MDWTGAAGKDFHMLYTMTPDATAFSNVAIDYRAERVEKGERDRTAPGHADSTRF